MHYRKLGSSDLEVSVLAFGAWQIGDQTYWGPHSAAEAQGAVDAAVDGGINLFDTAEMYGKGESERVLGTLLGGRRKDVLIASKVGSAHCAPKQLRAACERSLSLLGTDVIDLYQVHWPCRDVPFEDTYAEMVRLRDEGKIRAIGVSNFGTRDLTTWMASGECVSNQLGYNLLFRAIEYEIVPACTHSNLGILAYMPVMQGLLAGRWQSVDDMPMERRRTRHFASDREGVRHGEPGCEDLTMDTVRQLERVAADLGESLATVAVAWLMAQPGVATVIVGGRNPDQLARNLAAAELTLDEGCIARLNAITDPLKQELGSNPDMWKTVDETRIR